MKFNNIINYFVPKKYADDKELSRKSRFIVWFVFITNTIGIFFSFLIFLQNPQDKFNILLGLFYIPLFVFALFHFRKKGSFIFTTHFMCSIFFLATGFMPNSTGGIFSPDMPTFYILPIFAMIMGSYRIGLFYAMLTAATFVCYYFVGTNNPQPYLEQVSLLSADYFFSNLLLNFLVISFLVFRNENLRLKILDELRTTNVIISQKSKEITDSINYAKRIQTAILPELSRIKNHFPNSFILYQPKDIVSGDFYWMTEKNNVRFLAVADCTGHGVPGALMSMIGVSQLNAIVQEKEALDPSQILEKLDHRVVNILKQNQTVINDGMDIALIRINSENNILDYAGANRSLYYVRNGQLTEIKATKSPIGGADHGKEKKFQSVQLQLKEGDMIYLSTDGYADQFGSEKNKKITTKKFKIMLEQIAAQQPLEQEQFLLDFFNSFKRGYEQTDDVLVAGLRI